jgi:hypothetical protein
MKPIYLLVLIFCFFVQKEALSQDEYKVSKEFPYGKINPKAPKELAEYAELIGKCDCKSMRKNAQGTFTDTVNTVWEFRYIFNGMAIQDESWKEGGRNGSSIRQFNSDSLQWYVTYFASANANPTPKTWTGEVQKEKGDIVLKAAQKAPNGLDGFSVLRFYEISESGFKWLGQWEDPTGKYKFPFWKIVCEKQK